MLSAKDNELITRVGPGTPMGELMRQYWVPACLSSELPKPDGDPLRVLLFGERLVAFRDTDGRVGLMPHQCPHKKAFTHRLEACFCRRHFSLQMKPLLSECCSCSSSSGGGDR